jgi:hypothetical protein
MENAYAELAKVARLAGQTAEAQRADQAAARYRAAHADFDAAQERAMQPMAQSGVGAGIRQAMMMSHAFAGYNGGDHAALRRELEQATSIDPASLSILGRLELEAGDKPAALAAFRDAAEEQMRVLNLWAKVGGARNGSAMVASGINNMFIIESSVSMLAQMPDAPAGAQWLWFWLIEERKGRLFDSLTFPMRGDAQRDRVLADLRAARSAVAAQFLRKFRPLAPGARCVDGEPDPALVKHIEDIETSLLAFTPTPEEQRSIFQGPLGGGLPRSAYPKGGSTTKAA